MEATRRAFMNLPHPGSPDYHIPDDSMTALIHFFFLHRRRPKIADYRHHRSRKGNLEHLDRIEKWIHRELPDLPNHFQGTGGSSARALQFILDRLRQEGYVKGLEEDLWGIYTTRVTCKTCGYDCKKLSSEMMVSFYSELDKFQFFQYLTDHEAVANKAELQKELYNAQQEVKGNNKITRFLSVQHLFNFAERFCYAEQEGRQMDRYRHDLYNFRNVSSGACDIRFRTTFNQFPLNLIVDIDYMRAKFRGCIIIDEFIDLSQLAESETSTPTTANAKYKLVVVGDVLVDNTLHAISYVRASKYANDSYCRDNTQINIPWESMWYKVDNSNVELVPFIRVLERMQEHNLLIYEKEEQQQLNTQNENKQRLLSTLNIEQLQTKNKRTNKHLKNRTR